MKGISHRPATSAAPYPRHKPVALFVSYGKGKGLTMNIVEYRTVSAISSKELDNSVNRQLKLGYQPFGTPYVAGSGSTQSLYQALVRFEGTPEAPAQVSVVPPDTK